MRTQIKPSAIEENFASNQNIANSVNACYSLYCKVAGDGKGNYFKDTTFEGPKINWATKEVTPDGLRQSQKFMKNLMNDRFQGSMNDAISFMQY